MKTKLFYGIVITLLLTLSSGLTFAHCDTMEGPVVKAAKEALKKGDINYVLMWVKKDDEAAIKKLFTEVLSIRKLGKEAETLADMYFFESLVRIHRAGEGFPYTGLKSGEVEKPIALADNAIVSGSIDSIKAFLNNGFEENLLTKFKAVLAKKSFDISKPEEGREYVEAYITFMHYVEGIHASIESKSEGDEEASVKEEPSCSTSKEKGECDHNNDVFSGFAHVFHLLIILGALNLIGMVWLLVRSFKKK